MRPIKIQIQGFGPFQRQTSLRFPSAGSFNQLVGENLVEPQLGPNGVGKSKFWDALSWVLYGKTIRGMRGPVVKNWTGVDLCKVQLWFSHKGRSYRLVRTASPNAIKLRSKRTEFKTLQQEALTKFLGVTWESFCNIVVVGQFAQLFFDLSPTEKLKQFQDALQLGIWNSTIEFCSFKIKNAQAAISSANIVIGEIKGRLKELEQYNPEADYKTVSRLSKLIEEKDLLIREDENRIKAARLLFNKYTAQEKSLQLKVDFQKGAPNPLVAKIEDYRNKQAKAIAELDVLRNERVRLRDSLSKLQTKVGGECPTCLQLVTEKHAHSVERATRKKLVKIKRDIEQAEERREKYKKLIQRASARLEEATKASAELISELNELKVKIAEMSGNIKLYDERCDENTRKRNEWDFTIADIRAASNNRKRRIKKLKKRMAIKQVRVDDRLVRMKRWEAVQVHMRNLRLWLVDTALAELKTLTNSYMQELGMSGWKAEFAVERETADGKGLIKGFSVLIYSPASPHKAMPWEAFSGGESQRLRIAGTCALSALLRNRLGINVPLEVWDEPTAHLSEQGIDDLITFFKIRSRKLDVQLWVVDHRSLSHGQFDNRWKVIKGDAGSEIKEL